MFGPTGYSLGYCSLSGTSGVTRKPPSIMEGKQAVASPSAFSLLLLSPHLPPFNWARRVGCGPESGVSGRGLWTSATAKRRGPLLRRETRWVYRNSPFGESGRGSPPIFILHPIGYPSNRSDWPVVTQTGYRTASYRVIPSTPYSGLGHGT